MIESILKEGLRKPLTQTRHEGTRGSHTRNTAPRSLGEAYGFIHDEHLPRAFATLSGEMET